MSGPILVGMVLGLLILIGVAGFFFDYSAGLSPPPGTTRRSSGERTKLCGTTAM